MGGTGGINKQGSGTLTLTGANNYGGGTTVSGGTLAVSSGGSISHTGTGKNLIVGNESGENGALLLENNGSIAVGGYTEVARVAGSQGAVTITSGTYANTGNISVGTRGTGSMNVSGGTLSGLGYYVGDQTGGNGTFNVTGGSVQAAGQMFIGSNGKGAMTVSGGAAVTVQGYSTVGNAVGSEGELTMTGGTFSNVGNFAVGTHGTGTVTISGGSLSAAGYYIGDLSDGTGTLNMSGGTLTASTEFNFGFSGAGTVTISKGVASAPTTYIGRNSGSNGTVTLSGNASGRGVLLTSQVRRGSGTGNLIFDGGILRATGNQSSFISGFAAGNIQIQSGGVFIDSNGFSIATSSPFQGAGGLTKQGVGNLTLSGSHAYTGGTTVGAGTLTITNNTAFNSAITVNSGATLTLNIASDVNLLKGISGVGSVNVSGSGATARLSGDNGGFTGTFTLPLGSRGMMWSAASAGSALAKWELSGVFAVIETGAGDSTVKLGELSGTNAVTELSAFDGSGLKTFEVGALGTNSTFAGVIQDAHTGTATVALTKVGAGSLTLTATNAYTGGTTVSAGKLLVSGSITGTTTVQSAGTLGGTGSVLGDTTVTGTLAPGAGVGLLTFGNNLSLQGGSVTTIELGGKTVSLFDQVSVFDLLTYGGTLSLSLINGFTPQVGDTFQLFKDFNSQSGTFSSIAFSNPGIVGNFNYSTGTLSIVAIPEPSTAAICAVGLLGMFGRRRRTWK